MRFINHRCHKQVRFLLILSFSVLLIGCSNDFWCWPGNCGKTSSGTTDTTESVTLISPNGGETWEANGIRKESISWSKTAGVNSVIIDLYKDGVFHSQIRGLDPDTGANFIVPSGVDTDNKYKIKITSTTDLTVYDFSDANFSILGLYDIDG